MGEVNIIRDRERIQNKYMEEEDRFTLLYSQLSLLPLQPFTFSLSLYTFLTISLLVPIYRQQWQLLFFNNTAAHGLMHLSMVGAATIDKW